MRGDSASSSPESWRLMRAGISPRFQATSASSSPESWRLMLRHRGTPILAWFPSRFASAPMWNDLDHRVSARHRPLVLGVTPFASAASVQAQHFRAREERRSSVITISKIRAAARILESLPVPMAEEGWSVAHGRPMLAVSSASASWKTPLKQSSPGCAPGTAVPSPRSAGRGRCPPVPG